MTDQRLSDARLAELVRELEKSGARDGPSYAALTELQERRKADRTLECTNPEKCTCACGDIARATAFIMDTRLGGE